MSVSKKRKEEVRNEGHYEKNVPTKQCKAKKDSWLYGKDEHKGRAQCVETEEVEGKKEVDRLIPPEPLRKAREITESRAETIRFRKEGKDLPISGFQKRDEIGKKVFFEEYRPFRSEK